jgi:hypothetical protein
MSCDGVCGRFSGLASVVLVISRRNFMRAFLFGVVAALALGAAAPVMAAPVTFGGQPGNHAPYTEGAFTAGPRIQIDNSNNCPFGSRPCVKLNNGNFSTFDLTRTDGGLFDFTGFDFSLEGQGRRPFAGNTLTVTLFDALNALIGTIVLSTGNPLYPHNTDLSWLGSYTDLSRVTFTSTNGGTVRIDNIGVTPSAVPLPATAGMLLAGLGGLALIRRRRAA